MALLYLLPAVKWRNSAFVHFVWFSVCFPEQRWPTGLSDGYMLFSVRYELVLCIIYMTVNLQTVNCLILIAGLSARVRQTTVAKLQLTYLGSFFLDPQDIKEFYVHVTMHRDMWPCIVTNFFTIKPTRCTNFTNLFCHETLHVSDSSSVHHQEFIHCTLSNGICHTGFCRQLSSGTRMQLQFQPGAYLGLGRLGSCLGR